MNIHCHLVTVLHVEQQEDTSVFDFSSQLRRGFHWLLLRAARFSWVAVQQRPRATNVRTQYQQRTHELRMNGGVCTDQAGAEWHYGQQAALALSDWIAQQAVTCESNKLDKYKRHLARCYVAGQDLGQWMVIRGWAVPYRDCKCEAVRAAADRAKAQHIGSWVV